MAPVALEDVYPLNGSANTKLTQNTSVAPAVKLHQDTGKYQGYDNVHWYVGNAKQAGKSVLQSSMQVC